MSKQRLSAENLFKRAGLVLLSPIIFALGIAYGVWYALKTLVEMWQDPNEWTWL